MQTKKQLFAVIASSTIIIFCAVIIAQAVTTIGNNVSIGGGLTVANKVGIGTTTAYAMFDLKNTFGEVPFRIASSNGATMVTVTEDGWLGIGSSPLSMFSVQNASDDIIPRIVVKHTQADGWAEIDAYNDADSYMGFWINGTASNNADLENIPSGGVLANSGTGGLVINANASGAAIRFAIGGTSFSAEKMRIKSDGKIGIGTTTPSVQLHIVNGTATTTMAIGSGNILTKRGKLCQWNGTDYTITEFAASSITPIYSTSTVCQ